MKRIALCIVISLFAAMLFYTNAFAEETSCDWAIMVYLCGSDLESDEGSASEDIYEMIDAETAGNACFLVETGGAKKWMIDTIDANKLERYGIMDGEGEYIESLEYANMGEADTLKDFVTWAMSTVSANHYGLILWDHGSGSINGVCFDENCDDDSLTLSELQTALEGVPKLDLIGFDACLMASYETASALADHAMYLIASEETEAGYGWDYTELGNAMGEGKSAQELGKIVCDSFYRMNEELGEADICTMAVIDLSQIDRITEKLDAASAAMEGLLSESSAIGSISKGIAKTENYGGNNKAEGYTNMVDLGDMMLQVSDTVPEARECLEAIQNAVVYQVHGDKRSRANGLSVYYPLSVQGTQEIAVFESINPSKGYVSFVKSMLYGSVTGEIETLETAEKEHGGLFSHWSEFLESFEQDGAEYETKINFVEEAHFNEEGYYEFRLDTECLDYVQSIQISLCQYLYETDTVYYLGNDNNIYGDWETGEFLDNFDGTWPSLPDNQELMFYILEEDEAYTLYSAPIILNGEEKYLRFSWVWDDPNDYENEDGKFVVLDVWDGVNDNGSAGRGYTEIKEGDVIMPIYYGAGAENADADEYTGEEYTVMSDFCIEDLPLREGIYDYAFEITDVWGHTVSTDSALFYIDENGDITYDD